MIFSFPEAFYPVFSVTFDLYICYFRQIDLTIIGFQKNAQGVNWSYVGENENIIDGFSVFHACF